MGTVTTAQIRKRIATTGIGRNGASTVLAEKFNNVAHVCVGIAVQQEIALEEKEKRL